MDDLEAFMALMGCCCCEEEGSTEAGGSGRRAAGTSDLAESGEGGRQSGAGSQPLRRAPLPGMPPLKRAGVLDEPFVPPPPSYDSPQRPGAWGAGFIPSVQSEPPQPPRVFSHTVPPPPPGAEPGAPDAGDPPPRTPFFPREFQGPDGGATPLPETDPLRVIAGRGAVKTSLIQRRAYEGWAYALDPYDPEGTGVYHPRGEVRATPEELSPFGPLPAITLDQTHTITRPLIEYRYNQATGENEWRRAEEGTRTLEVRVSPEVYPEFDATEGRWQEVLVAGTWTAPLAAGAPRIIERRGPIRTAVLEGASGEGGGRHQLIFYVGIAGRRWKLARRLEDSSGVVGDWNRAVVLEIKDRGDPFPWDKYNCWRLNTMPFTRLDDPPALWRDRTWQTPDSSVRWTQAGEGAPWTLTAYGHTLTGGSWAGLSGPVRARDDGSPDFSDALILHEAGGSVTLISSDGQREACGHGTFEEAVLRSAGGAFEGFSPIGLGANVWPPQWAWAITGEDEARAVIAWDAWRDSTRREWAGRPKRRPPLDRPLRLPEGLRPPLGVTLATTGRQPRYEEPLLAYLLPPDDPDAAPVQQAPYHLPGRVQVLRGGAWVDDPAAFVALSKGALYPPARAAEALDDRSSVRGPLRVAWAGEAMPAGERKHAMRAGLLLRARGKSPTLKVNGADISLRPLGRNAGERGWQPYLAVLDAPYRAVLGGALNLECSAPLSRLLLVRIGLGRGVETGPIQ